MNKIHIIVVLACSMLLCSCFEFRYSEEIWLNKDWSGKYKFKIGFDQTMLDATSSGSGLNDVQGWQALLAQESTLVEKLEIHESIDVISHKSYNDSSLHWIQIVFEFQSLQDLNSIDIPFLGHSKLNKTDNGTFIFNREFDILGDEMMTEDLDQAMVFAAMSGTNWKYKIHFPHNIIDANTKDSNIDIMSNTVFWSVSSYSVLNNDFIQSAFIEAPTDYLSILKVALLIVIPIVLVIFYFQRNIKTSARKEVTSTNDGSTYKNEQKGGGTVTNTSKAIYIVSGALLSALLFIIYLLYVQSGEFEELTVKKIKVVDDSNHLLVEIGGNRANGGGIWLFDNREFVVANFTGGTEGGQINLYNGSKSNIVYLGPTSGNTGLMEIYNEDGELVNYIGNGLVRTHSNNGDATTVLGNLGLEDVGGLHIMAKDFKTVIELSASGKYNNGLIKIFNDQGSSVGIFGANAYQDGYLQIYNKSGVLRTEAGGE